jgi:uncharacterized protein YecE (DUF72 family)
MIDLKIGTSGYDYLDWISCFYPKGLKRENFLPYYIKQFSTVELNFSYYKIPNKQQMINILYYSRNKIDFAIKAHGSMTHNIDPATWKDTIKQYQTGIEPLCDDDKLNAILFQFPYSFDYNQDNRFYLDKLINEMKSFPLVVEFRNSRWMSQRVFDALQKRGVGFCSIDAPRLKGLPPGLDIVTSDIAYIRFHGRNELNWWGTNATARFDYNYTREELSGWISRIKTMVTMAKKIRIYFNNHYKGKAPNNALILKSILKNTSFMQEN